ncbi:hypothetical protein CI109_103435 [Kwoniella shandongensis]|uniref:DUF7330 domain-containing protein n=1 Tax=Kwoniella shandongensis TaxID=1734106 RepID=A0A5M6BZF9_9TREE|nr:uncharacterized protein CI109_004515 [Kwoniella shandongensis]KAA5527222.1 hypothetical protein CI109_004515 [Kwoniella shandongensis]
MAVQYNNHLSHSLPIRSPSQRPRSLSLSEYQPLSFDRDALTAAYQASLGLPTSSNVSSISHPSQSSFGGLSTETHDTSITGTGTGSTLSHKLRAGDNPHARSMSDIPIPPPPMTDDGNFAGIGAGHTLTPPGSPLHKAAQQVHQQSLLSPVPGSPVPVPPSPPARPARIPSSTFKPQLPPRLPSQRPSMASSKPSPPPMTMRRSQSDIGVDRDTPWQGQHEWIEGDGRGRGKRRALPAVPTNIPVPEPPQWEPDYKPQIPDTLTAPSAQHAYASLSAPPPNLPPRRTQQRPQQGYRTVTSSTTEMGGPSTSSTGIFNSQAGSSIGHAGPSASSSSTVHGGSTGLPQGAPEFPPTLTSEPSYMSAATTASRPPRPEAEKEVFLRSTDKTPIWSTHYLDPTLRQTIVNVPHQVTNIANVALSGVASGPKTLYNTTIGAPIDGLAKAAKDWIVSPDGRFISEHGGVELGVGVINAGGDGWGKDKGRKKARVEVVSKSGGIKVDIVELDNERQIDLRIDTRTGDVLVLLPENFIGPIHITSPNQPPVFLSILGPLLKPLANPYASLYTTFMVPLALSRDPRYASSIEHTATKRIERYIPGSFREDQSEILDQIAGGFMSHGRGEHSKLVIRSEKGRVVLGLKESKDEEDWKALGLRVGVMDGGRKGKKRWWRP